MSISPTFLEAKHASDVALVRALTEGRDEALNELYTRHAPYVRAAARRAVPNRDLAEEATQDAFLQLWAVPQRFDPDRGSVRAYLQMQASRRAIDAGRSELARRRREEHHLRRSPASSGDLVGEVIVDLAEAGQVRGALTGLDPRQRQALELAYFAGHSYRQVAVLLGQPEGTVKNRIRSGLRRLRSLLGHVRGPFAEVPFA